MENFYGLLKDYKENNSLSYSALGRIINKNPDAFRQAVNRESLSDLEKEKLGALFKNKSRSKMEASSVNPRIEDIIADKILDELKPYFLDINKKLDEMKEANALQNSDLKEIIDNLKADKQSK